MRTGNNVVYIALEKTNTKRISKKLWLDCTCHYDYLADEYLNSQASL